MCTVRPKLGVFFQIYEIHHFCCFITTELDFLELTFGTHYMWFWVPGAVYLWLILGAGGFILDGLLGKAQRCTYCTAGL